MTLKSKKRVRPPIRTTHADADPLGLFSALSEQLKQTYDAEVRAFLRKFLLVGGLAPAVRRRILEAGTAQGGPVSFDLRITVHPHDASGFVRVVGKLAATSAELSDEERPDEQPDAPGDGPYIETLFGKRVPVSQLKARQRRFGRRR